MIYKVSVYTIGNGKKKWIYSKEVMAENPAQAVDIARIRLSPDRLVEICEAHQIQRPQINRIERNGVI